MNTPLLLPYQKQTLDILSYHPICVIEKSRRIGITWTLASEMPLRAAAPKDKGGTDVLYMGYNYSMAREFMAQCAYFSHHYQLYAGKCGEYLLDEKKDIKIFRIDFKNGCKIEALTSEPRSIRGRQGIVVIDEAAFHHDLPNIMKAVVPMLIWGGKVVIVSTHNGKDNPFYQLVNDIRAKRKNYGLLRIDFNQAISDGLYKRICKVRKEKWTSEKQNQWIKNIIEYHADNADEELFCIAAENKEAFLPVNLIEKNMKDDIAIIRIKAKEQFVESDNDSRKNEVSTLCQEQLEPILEKIEKRAEHTIGIDFGRKRDLSVFWVIAIMSDLKRKTAFVIEMANTPFEQQKQVLLYIAQRLPKLTAIALDGGGNGAYLAEIAKQNYDDKVEIVHLSEKWYRQNMPRLKAALEDDKLTLPKDADILADLRSLRTIRGVTKIPENARTKGKDGTQRHGDAAIACALAYYATTIETQRYGWHGVYDAKTQQQKDDYDDLLNENFGAKKTKWR